jgi:hypothetical protein
MLYAQGAVTGVGFLTHADREDNGVDLKILGNILVVPDGCEAWLSRNSLAAISKSAAQALYDSHMDTAISAFDPDDNNEERSQPVRKTLP